MQYPLGISDSQYYKSMIENPPEGIQYENKIKRIGMIHNEKRFFLFNFLKNKIRTWTSKLDTVIPNAHKTPSGDYDIIHCGHCLSKNQSPHVIDVESVWQFWISGRGREEVLKYLINNNCKKIIAWTEATKQDIIKQFPEVEDKIEVVYYAMPWTNRETKKSRVTTLFFSGRHFYAKGGLHATEAMDRLTKKYPNVRGVINGVIPKEIIEKYSDNKKLEFHGLMPHEDILKLYEAADIFIYPGYSDSFGFVFVEAMAFGLPIITVDGYARKEIVGESGIIIERPSELDIKKIEESVIANIVDETSTLIENKKLLMDMSEECKLNISKGKFSIEERNSKLSRIYRDVVKDKPYKER